MASQARSPASRQQQEHMSKRAELVRRCSAADAEGINPPPWALTKNFPREFYASRHAALSKLRLFHLVEEVCRLTDRLMDTNAADQSYAAKLCIVQSLCRHFLCCVAVEDGRLLAAAVHRRHPSVVEILVNLILAGEPLNYVVVRLLSFLAKHPPALDQMVSYGIFSLFFGLFKTGDPIMMISGLDFMEQALCTMSVARGNGPFIDVSTRRRNGSDKDRSAATSTASRLGLSIMKQIFTGGGVKTFLSFAEQAVRRREARLRAADASDVKSWHEHDEAAILLDRQCFHNILLLLRRGVEQRCGCRRNFNAAQSKIRATFSALKAGGALSAEEEKIMDSIERGVTQWEAVDGAIERARKP
jgi:hypothetical protein